MADKVILIREGRIEQEGTPDILYDKPATAFTAAFIGTPPMNLLNTIISDGGLVIEGENRTPVLEAHSKPAFFGIRPEHISISDNHGIAAELVSADYLGAETVITARIGSQEILIRSAGRVSVPRPVAARLEWRPEDVHVFDSDTGMRNDSVKASEI